MIDVHLVSEPRVTHRVVEDLAHIKGPLDIYCWYEGFDSIPKAGASFMKQSIFEPLFALKRDVKIYLCSLKSWDFTKSLSHMETSTALGEAINQINIADIECIYSRSFFQYCTRVSSDSGVYHFINEIPFKRLSADTNKCGMRIDELLDFQPSLLDGIADLDARSAYPFLRYIEAYYFVRESVRKGLRANKSKITIAFALPNDEGKYYQEFSKDLEKILLLDFGQHLSDIKIAIVFQFFQYGASSHEKPHRGQDLPKVRPEEIHTYFDYLAN